MKETIHLACIIQKQPSLCLFRDDMTTQLSFGSFQGDVPALDLQKLFLKAGHHSEKHRRHHRHARRSTSADSVRSSVVRVIVFYVNCT